MGSYFNYSPHYAPSETKAFDTICGILAENFKSETGREPTKWELATRLFAYAHETDNNTAMANASLQRRVIEEFYGHIATDEEALDAFVLASTCELIANGEVPYDRTAKRRLSRDYHPVAIADTNGWDQGTPEQQAAWRAMRQHYGIGGSETPSIHGINPFDNNVSVYNKKMGIEKTPGKDVMDASTQFRLDIGHAAEEPIARYIADTLRVERMWNDTVMYRHPYYPWMIADLDRRLTLRDEDGNKYNAILEIKTASFTKRDEWASVGVPAHYVLQTRHYMSVMNINKTYITCYFGGNNAADMPCIGIQRDLEAEQGIIETDLNFWLDNVLTETPPEPNGDGNVQKNVNYWYSKYSDPSRAQVPIPEEYRNDIMELVALKEQKSALAKTVDELEKKIAEKQMGIITLLDTATEGVFDLDKDKFILFTYKGRNVSKLDKKGLKLALPEVYKRFLIKEGEGERTLYIKVSKKSKTFVMPSN